MGRFKRQGTRHSGCADPDREFAFFTEAAGARFRALVRAVFAEQGLEATVHDALVVDAAGRQFGLHNLAAKCHAEPAGEPGWHATITAHVVAVLRAMSDGCALETLNRDEVLARTFVRIVGACTLPSMAGLRYARRLSDDMIEVLALDCPQTVGTLSDEHVLRFGLDDLRAAGVVNCSASRSTSTRRTTWVAASSISSVATPRTPGASSWSFGTSSAAPPVRWNIRTVCWSPYRTGTACSITSSRARRWSR